MAREVDEDNERLHARSQACLLAVSNRELEVDSRRLSTLSEWHALFTWLARTPRLQPRSADGATLIAWLTSVS